MSKSVPPAVSCSYPFITTRSPGLQSTGGFRGITVRFPSELERYTVSSVDVVKELACLFSWHNSRLPLYYISLRKEQLANESSQRTQTHFRLLLLFARSLDAITGNMSGFAGEKDSGVRKIKMSLAIIGEKRGLIRLVGGSIIWTVSREMIGL